MGTREEEGEEMRRRSLEAQRVPHHGPRFEADKGPIRKGDMPEP